MNKNKHRTEIIIWGTVVFFMQNSNYTFYFWLCIET